MQKTNLSSTRQTLLLLTFLCFAFALVLQSCQKSKESFSTSEQLAGRKKNPNNPPPPPPPQPIYFANWHEPIMSGSISAGVPVNVTMTLTYFNGNGTGYPAFTSSTVNGITVSTPAGNWGIGNGSIVFTVTGTAVVPGVFRIPIAVGTAVACQAVISVHQTPPDPSTCGEPGLTPGSTGCVTFTYRGQTVTYYTVRARDGKVWIQQNLGSPHVALNENDHESYGHYFQWGRWDDGHQLTTSTPVAASSSLQNPSHIPSGIPNLIIANGGISWWSTGAPSDTWSGTVASATNGKDPCAALGTGWRMPSRADWQNLVNYEGITSIFDAISSSLKLPGSGYRLFSSNSEGYYWSSTTGNTTNGTGNVLFFDPNYNVGLFPANREYAFPCRCVKD